MSLTSLTDADTTGKLFSLIPMTIPYPKGGL
jgi:hypothetical protein